MSDLAIGYVIIGVAAVALFAAAALVACRLSAVQRNAAAVLVVVGLFVYIETLWDDVRLARLLPFANLVVVGNWLPLFAALLAGLVWRHAQGSPLRRSIVLGHLVAAGLIASLWPILGRVPQCDDKWDRLGTCLQTTSATCSPAAAATLLRRYGIEASEQEMAELCLTRQGTSWQGLYRGLKHKTAGTPWDVEIREVEPAVLAAEASGPMIVSVGLDRDYPPQSEFAREFGWIPGVNHSVVIERFATGGSAVIADPSLELSREYLDPDTLNKLWRGYAIRLVPRS